MANSASKLWHSWTTTFCTARLARALHLQRKPETLTLSTMENPSRKAKTQAVSIQVLSTDGQTALRMEVFTRPSLPISTEYQATVDDI